MDAKVEQPPQKRKKNKNTTSPPPPSFSSLPDDIIVNCLARTSRSYYRSLSLLSKSIRSLISSPELYATRSRIGNIEPCLYLRQELPTYDRWYTLDQTLVTSGRIEDESSLSPIRPSSSAPPKLSTTVSVGFEIYQMGGTINNDKQPSSAVRVLDCRTRTWRDAPNMTVARKGAHSAFIDGKIYVFGGTEESMSWVEVFDLKTQTWKPLPSPNDDDDAKAKLYGGNLYIRSEHKRYSYDPKEERWKEITLQAPGFGPDKHRIGPWCVIENVKFSFDLRKLMWYDSEHRIWLMVEGLEDLYRNPAIRYPTIRLANYCGKLIILWDEPRSLEFPVARRPSRSFRCKYKRIWCAVIRLEKRIGFYGLEISGEIERLNPVLTVPNSYEVLCCITL